jgi:hypothetical protein
MRVNGRLTQDFTPYIMRSMTPQEAIERAGSQAELMRLFSNAGWPVSRQAVSNWLARKELPPARILQLQRLKPRWFRNGAR